MPARIDFYTTGFAAAPVPAHSASIIHSEPDNEHLHPHKPSTVRKSDLLEKFVDAYSELEDYKCVGRRLSYPYIADSSADRGRLCS